jgi:hypothetical protein
MNIDKQITARILYVSLSLAHKSIALTLLPHALALQRPDSLSANNATATTTLGPDYGMIIEKAIVRKVENGMGLWCTMDSIPDLLGFVHVRILVM